MSDAAAYAAADLPPGPFEYETTAAPGDHHGKGHVYLVDATGRRIASLWGPAATKMALADLAIRASRQGPSILGTAAMPPMPAGEVQMMIDWLRGMAERGGKGGVDNVDARALGRVAALIERQRAVIGQAYQACNDAQPEWYADKLDRVAAILRLGLFPTTEARPAADESEAGR